jgi:O-antigen/teichoic acid export membrane protein
VRLLKDSAIIAFSEATGAVALFFTGILTARALGPDGKGVYTLSIGMGALAAFVLSLRWQRPTGHFLAKDASTLPTIITSNVIVCAIATLLALAIWRAYPPLIEQGVLKGLDPGLIGITIGLIAATYLTQMLTAVYGGMRSFGLRAVFMIVSNTLNVLPIVALFLLGERRPWVYVASLLVAWGVLNSLWLAAFIVRRRVRPRLDLALIQRMARYGALTYPALIFDLMILRLDIFIMNYLSDAEKVGIYSVAVGLANQLGRIPTVLVNIVFNRVSADELGGGEKTAQIVRLAAIAMLLGGAALAALGALLITPLYGAEFAPSIAPLLVMVPATVFIGLYRIICADIDGRGRPGLVTLCSLTAAVGIVVLDFWWIPIWGVMGAAWASLAAYALAFVAAGLVFCRISGLRFWSAYTPRAADVVALWAALRAASGALLKRWRRERPPA